MGNLCLSNTVTVVKDNKTYNCFKCLLDCITIKYSDTDNIICLLHSDYCALYGRYFLTVSSKQTAD